MDGSAERCARSVRKKWVGWKMCVASSGIKAKSARHSPQEPNMPDPHLLLSALLLAPAMTRTHIVPRGPLSHLSPEFFFASSSPMDWRRAQRPQLHRWLTETFHAERQTVNPPTFILQLMPPFGFLARAGRGSYGMPTSPPPPHIQYKDIFRATAGRNTPRTGSVNVLSEYTN